jgi:hypothetical protein
MRRLLPDKGKVFHLHEHAIWESEDGTYEYMSWDEKDDTLSWINGKAFIIGDVLCLAPILSDGEEEIFNSKLDVEFELNQRPKWDKTKYYCVIIVAQIAAMLQYCDTGEAVELGGDDYNTVKEMLREAGADLQ